MKLTAPFRVEVMVSHVGSLTVGANTPVSGKDDGMIAGRVTGAPLAGSVKVDGVTTKAFGISFTLPAPEK